LQSFRTGHIELAVRNSRGDQQYFAADIGAPGQFDNPRGAFHVDARDLLGGENFDSESPGLGHGTPRQVTTAQS